jgi:hypothetical protein
MTDMQDSDWTAPKPLEGELHNLYLMRVVGSFEEYANKALRAALYRQAGDRDAHVERLNHLAGL